jgi:lipopolysaccharide transport system permease protein
MTRLRDSVGRYRSLVLYKVYAELRAESERTYVGFMWWFIDPIVTMFVYYLVFAVILKTRTDNVLGFLFVGILSWRWFQTSIMHGANSILAARSLMQNVYLPKVIFPVVTVLSDTVKFLVVLVVMVAALPVFGFPIGLTHLALFPVVLAQLLLIAGCTTLAAAIVPVIPDIRMVLQNFLRMVFFLSGIFYDISKAPDELQRFMMLNPVAVLIKMYRQVLLEGAAPSYSAAGLIAVFSLIIGSIGVIITRRLDVFYPKLR